MNVLSHAHWQRFRARWNHDWLRNQLIMALNAAQISLDDRAADQDCLDRVIRHLEQWPERREEARTILQGYGIEGVEDLGTTRIALDNLDPHMREFLLESERARHRKMLEDSGLSKAQETFERLDAVLTRLLTAAGGDRRRLAASLDSARVGEIRELASRLANAVTCLGPGSLR